MTMHFAPPPRKPRAESIVPMINVVFLLLVFFLMTSTLSQPEPFDVTPPEITDGIAAERAPVLYLARDGRIAFDAAEGESAVQAFAAAALRAAASDGYGIARTPRLRADAEVPAARVTGVLRSLTEAGLDTVSVVVSAP